MAWLDDRAWCHPKFTDLTSDAFRVYWCGVSYSSGMSTGGVLSPAQQRMLGSTDEIVRELSAARLWDVRQDGSVDIHDWDDHNGKRDARRAADRERKRLAREAERNKPPADIPADSPADGPVDSPQDGSALTVVTEVTGDGSDLETGEPLRGKPRDIIWDALIRELGEPTNDIERGVRNTAVKALRQSGATPGEIITRCRRYREAWPEMALTAPALAKHWQAFAHPVNGQQSPTRIATMFDEEEHDASAGRALGSGD